MVKVTLGNTDPSAFAQLRGRVYVRLTKHGPVVQAWPRKRGRAKSGYDYYRQAEFGIAAKWAANPGPLDLYTATEMAKGTLQVPRDILQMAMYGYYYVFILPDGREMIPAREMTNNPQYILDLVTEEIGSLLVRTQIGWVGLPPGPDGWALTMQGGEPSWAPASGSGGGVPVWLGPDSQDGNHDGIGTRAVRFRPRLALSIDAAAIEGHIQTSQALVARLFEATGMTLGAMLAESEPFTPAATQTQDAYLPFGETVSLDADAEYWLCISDANQSGGYNQRTNTTGGRWPGLVLASEAIGGRYDGGVPASGVTLLGYGPKPAVRLRQVA